MFLIAYEERINDAILDRELPIPRVLYRVVGLTEELTPAAPDEPPMPTAA